MEKPSDFVGIQTMSEPFYCHKCASWYTRSDGSMQVSCCVLHAPGDCCHYSDTKADAPDPPMRWGLYVRENPRMWAVTGPTDDHPSWWPYVWNPLAGVDLKRTDIVWTHEPSNEEVGDAISEMIRGLA